MSKTKPIKKNVSAKSKFVIDAIVVPPHSKLELYTSIKNIIIFYQQSFLELLASDNIVIHGDKIIRCHDALYKIYQEYKNLLSNDICLLINAIILESNPVYKLLTKRKIKNPMPSKQKALFESKRFTLDYLITSLQDSLSSKIEN